MSTTQHSQRSVTSRHPMLVGAVIGGLCASLIVLAGLGTQTNPPADSPDAIIKEMERKRSTPAPSATTPAAQPGSGVVDSSSTISTRLLREGTFITNRRGRLTRGSSGDLLFTFDADARGKGEAPMSLLPCMNLASMEKVVDRGGDGITFTLSGQVFVYKGRNYVLPTLYQVNRRSGDINTAQ